MPVSKADSRTPGRIVPILYGASLISISIVVSLLVVEVILRTAFDPLRVLDGDAMWEYRWRQAHAPGESPADSAEGYGFDVYDAVLGWRPRPDYETETVRTNALGIRAERDFDFERLPGTSRIVIVGDSFMWGEGVPNEQTFPSQLGNRLAHAEVINLGVHGYGTDQQLLRLRELGFLFEPHLVILGFYEDNMWRNVLSFRDYAKPRFRLVDKELVLDNQPVPSPEAILADDQRLPRSFLLVLVRRVLRRITWNSGRGLENTEEWQMTAAILEAAKKETEAHGANLLLLYVPTSNISQSGNAEVLLEAWARESETSLLNLRERFLDLEESDRMRLYRGHWTPFGNAVVAELVATHIASHDFGIAAQGDAG